MGLGWLAAIVVIVPIVVLLARLPPLDDHAPADLYEVFGTESEADNNDRYQ